MRTAVCFAWCGCGTFFVRLPAALPSGTPTDAGLLLRVPLLGGSDTAAGCSGMHMVVATLGPVVDAAAAPASAHSALLRLPRGCTPPVGAVLALHTVTDAATTALAWPMGAPTGCRPSKLTV